MRELPEENENKEDMVLEITVSSVEHDVVSQDEEISIEEEEDYLEDFHKNTGGSFNRLLGCGG